MTLTFGQPAAAAAQFQLSSISKRPLAKVLASLHGAVDRAGMKVLHEIDPQGALRGVGQEIGSAWLVFFFHPDLLALLRAWWQEGRQQGVIRPGGWLFPGQDPVRAVTTRQLSRVVEAAAEAAGLSKHVSPHTLRQGFATRLLEDGTIDDILGVDISKR